MRINDEFRHFVAVVAGDDPEGNMEPFDMNRKAETPYVVYHIDDAPKIRKDYIKFYETLLSGGALDRTEEEQIRDDLKATKEMGDLDFFYMITSEYEYDFETGDAISTDNPHGRWINCEIGKRFSSPFILKDGSEAYQARKKDIDWPRIHLNGREIYESSWDLVMEGKKPENEQEELIFNNMMNRVGYFSKFGTRENYVMASTAFWGLAFVDEDGWTELEDDEDQFEWMKGFYDRFIDPLPEDTLLSIYECRRV